LTYQEILKIVLLNWKRIIKITALSVVVIFLVLFFIFPVSYKAPVTVLPPEQNAGMGSLGTLLGTQDLSSLLTGGFSNANSQLYMEILKSRSAAEYVVKKHNLVK
jgi:tyrosine-protein kinase Etk/Wzc